MKDKKYKAVRKNLFDVGVVTIPVLFCAAHLLKSIFTGFAETESMNEQKYSAQRTLDISGAIQDATEIIQQRSQQGGIVGSCWGYV